MAGPLTATTFAIRQRTPIGVNLMIIIMICMMTLFILLTAPPTGMPSSPAARMPAPKKIATTMTGSISALTIGLSRLSGKMFTMTCMTEGDSLASYSRPVVWSSGNAPLKTLASTRPMTTAMAVVNM